MILILVSLSQNDISARSYDVDDIKLFLRATNNKRGVNVQDYFPDVKQFVEKTRSLMAEGSFTNKEVYCFKKPVINLGKVLNLKTLIKKLKTLTFVCVFCQN